MSDEARERFEEWATESGWLLLRNKDGSYCTRSTDAAWGGFMAALKARAVQEPELYKKGWQVMDCPACGFDGARGFVPQPVQSPPPATGEKPSPIGAEADAKS